MVERVHSSWEGLIGSAGRHHHCPTALKSPPAPEPNQNKKALNVQKTFKAFIIAS